jgi:hypothetical protein
MRITTGHVVRGQIVLDDWAEPIPEGTEITIGIPDAVEGQPELSPEDEAELAERVAEIERGDYITGEDLLRRLGRG